MPSAPGTIDRDNPWPGLASYDESAQAYFGGRGAETAELVRRISDEAVTVLFGKSGLGKSSLLRAGVFPMLRQRGLLPVPVRLHFGGGVADAVEQIAAALFAAFDAERIEYPARAVGETLWDYLHRAGLRFWTPKVRPVQPVLVLDQFEEVFTLGRSAPGVADPLREPLADLAENRIPAALAARVEAGDALPAALDVHARPYKLVCSLREDFLPDLEGWVADMPSLRRNRMRLLPLRREQALQAVCNVRTEHLVAAALARRIVDYLASSAETPEAEGGRAGDASVEPALLNLVCRGINEARKREGKASIDDALFEAGKGRIVADFYRESLADQPDRAARFVEDELVTEQGFRNSYSLVAATRRGRITAAEIATLVDRRLLRIEHHLGTERVELTHDLLTRAVLDARGKRQAAERAAAQWRWIWRVGSTVALGVAVLGFMAWQQLDRLQSERSTALAAAERDHERLSEIQLKNAALEKAQRATQEAQRGLEARNRDLIVTFDKLATASNDARVEAETAKRERARADELSLLARSREIAARAAAVTGRNRELAVLLGAEALRVADTPEARAALLDAARYAWPTTVLAPDQLGGDPRLVGLDASGRQLAVVARQGGQARLSLWDLSTRAPKSARWQRVFDPASVGFVVFTPDGLRLLVGRAGGVDQLDVQTGDPAAPWIPLPPGTGADPPAQLAVSVNGRWLAAALSSGVALIRDLGDPAASWETAAAGGATAISIADDGQRIATVGANPLRAAVVERSAAGGWSHRPLDVTACAKLQSVSSAASYAVATWRAQACRQSLDPGATADRAATREVEAIADSVASAFGPAFAAILSNGDLRVGTGDPSQPDTTSDVKGVRLSTDGNMLKKVSVNASATRVAWLERDGVHIVSLAGYKLLLAEYPDGAIASADGRRIVQARAGSRGAVVWMTPIAAVSEGRELPRSSWRQPLARLPERLEVRGDVVIVGVRSGEGRELATTIHDLNTGKVRAGPFAGAAELAGSDGQLLFVHPSRDGQGPAETQLVHLADGRVLGRWDARDGNRVVMSPGGTALLVLQPMAEPRTITAQALVVRGEQLVPAGRVVELPAAAAAAESIEIDDAATTLSERRTTRVPASAGGPSRLRREMLRWPLLPGRETSARDPAAAVKLPAPAADTKPAARGDDLAASPSARLVVRQVPLPGGGQSTVLARRDGAAVMHSFGARNVAEFRFSDDERWLAFIEEGTLQVFDLRTLQPVLTWRGLGARRAEFTRAGGLLRIERDDGRALLVPMDRVLLDGFARWLVTRELRPDERCEHGLDPAGCNAAPAAATRSKVAQARSR